MIYRSPWTRLILAAIGGTVGALLTFGGERQWRHTPSLHWLAGWLIPLQAWGVAFIVYGLMLLVERTRPAAYAAGAGLFAIFAVSLIATVNDGAPKNIVTIGALVDVIVFHVYSIRTAWALRLAR